MAYVLMDGNGEGTHSRLFQPSWRGGSGCGPGPEPTWREAVSMTSHKIKSAYWRRNALRAFAATTRRSSSGVAGTRGRTTVALPLSLTATIVKKQLFAWRTVWV